RVQGLVFRYTRNFQDGWEDIDSTRREVGNSRLFQDCRPLDDSRDPNSSFPQLSLSPRKATCGTLRDCPVVARIPEYGIIRYPQLPEPLTQSPHSAIHCCNFGQKILHLIWLIRVKSPVFLECFVRTVRRPKPYQRQKWLICVNRFLDELDGCFDGNHRSFSLELDGLAVL